MNEICINEGMYKTKLDEVFKALILLKEVYFDLDLSSESNKLKIFFLKRIKNEKIKYYTLASEAADILKEEYENFDVTPLREKVVYLLFGNMIEESSGKKLENGYQNIVDQKLYEDYPIMENVLFFLDHNIGMKMYEIFYSFIFNFENKCIVIEPVSWKMRYNGFKETSIKNMFYQDLNSWFTYNNLFYFFDVTVLKGGTVQIKIKKDI